MRRRMGAAATLCISALLLASGCVSGLRSTPARDGSPTTHRGWARVLSGDAASGLADFDGALAAAPDDVFARFGRTALSFEHGRTQSALEDLQTLLRQADAKEASPWAKTLATAASGWLSTLVHEDRQWRQRLETLTSLRGTYLPWLARTEILQVADDLARRAGREDAMQELARMAHCPAQAQVIGSAGRRPVLDLTAPVQEVQGARPPVGLSGCRGHVPAADGLPGVMVVRTTLDLPTGGDFDLVLDHRGLAAFRVDGGSWNAHGAASTWGPHRSAVRLVMKPGAHQVELRFSTYGGGADYWFAALKAQTSSFKMPLPPAGAAKETAPAIEAYVTVLLAGLEGSWHSGLASADRLRTWRRFGPGLVQAGRLAESDPSRPDNVTRDVARSSWTLAVEQDPKLVRARLALSALESMEGRSREASAQAQAARKQAPTWWPAILAAYETLNAEGLEALADEALDRGLELVNTKSVDEAWACPLIDAAARRARQREALAAVEPYLQLQAQCEARDLGLAARAYEGGEAARAAAAFERVARLSTSPQWLLGDQAAALAASGDVPGALERVERARATWPRDTSFVMRLANLQALARRPEQGRDTVTRALGQFPIASDVRQAARALGVALPVERERVDGLQVIKTFIREGRRYDAPAVFVLDRLVERVFPDGTRVLLTHNIVKVQSKDALDRWGEVSVPSGAEVLTLRTVKPNLTVREPEDIFGKESVSAPELEAGDFVEWETVETHEPSPAFAPGFLSQRFYFQSNEAPLDRSEYVIIHPDTVALDVDRRAGAPDGVVVPLGDGLAVLRFSARDIPQIFPERAAVAPLHWLPSVRVARAVSPKGWASFIGDRLATIARRTPAIDDQARALRHGAGGEKAKPIDEAKAIVAWVTENIESDGTVDEPATYAVARGRGNRLAVALALSQALALPAEPVLVRPLGVAAAAEPMSASEVMSFSDVLLYFPTLPAAGGKPGVFVDLRLRHAPFGYVPPQLDGALALSLPQGSTLTARSQIADHRAVELHVTLDAEGGATVAGEERLSGGPAAEWIEAQKQIGGDEEKRRRRFEEAYLAYHFPGANLLALRFDVQGNTVRLNYEARVDRFATVGADGMTVEPRFFLAQPGRRFATESERGTTLLMGPDLPLELTAAVEWPAGFAVVDAGEGLISEPLGARGPRFVESRTVERWGGDGRAARVVIRRTTQVPLVRVEPARYPALSAALRRVDSAEQAVIRVRRRPATPPTQEEPQ